MIVDKIILVRLYLLLIPIAYFSYLFHEFGHWIVGEILGNDMIYSLNYVWPKAGHYINESHNLYVSIGGPAFTVLLAVLSLLLLEKYSIIYAYPVLFFQFVLRFFSLAFGEFSQQDEARVASIMGLGTFTVGIIIMIILLLIIIRASYKLKIDLKHIGYFFTISILGELLVIATYKITGL
ncbi:MAG: hypothetical protein Q8933_21135 [Bacteroidota bacterium]|nr:hypothetical protein [Bacteroidota bacterium]MDP4197401.1 hypothetical protein [Bacteroidota bacterium]